MSDRTREPGKGPNTVLDPLRPAVVVRRRVYDATPSAEGEPPRAFTTGARRPSPEDEDESGPPSSINVARALASLRGDELQRVEELLRADEEREEEELDELPLSAEPLSGPSSDAGEVTSEAPATPTLVLGKTIALSDLAERMGISAQDLPATLVARGFYALNAKTVLPRQTARTIAEMYGWHVENDPNDGPDEPVATRPSSRSRIATKKSRTKSKPKVKVKSKAAAKPKRRLAR